MLARVVQPLLKLISEKTGFENITMLCGSAPADVSDNFKISAIHYGKTVEAAPRNFYEYDQEGFQLHVLPLFCRFLGATTGMSCFGNTLVFR